MILELLWTRGPHFFKHFPDPIQPRYRAPSWSWASIDVPVNYYGHGDLKMTDAYTRVINAACTSFGTDATGEVTSGFVNLKGPVIKALVRFPVDGVLGSNQVNLAVRKASSLNTICKFEADCPLIVEHEFLSAGTIEKRARRIKWDTTIIIRCIEAEFESIQNDVPSPDDSYIQVWCLYIGVNDEKSQSYALVLGTSRNKPGKFVRLGISNAPIKKHKKLFKKSVSMTITIV